jgi:hypothetical protein
MSEIKNAVIRRAYFDTERGLSAWLDLDYGGCCQGFGGYMLYLPRDWDHHGGQANYCGHFIYRVLQIAEVSDWAKLAGRTIRVKSEHSAVHAIGHIIKDDWFDPKVEFEALRQTRPAESKT